MKKIARFLLSSVSVFVFYFLLKRTVLFWIFNSPIETKLQPSDQLIQLILFGLIVGFLCWLIGLASERAAKYYTFPIIFFLLAFPLHLLTHFTISLWHQYFISFGNVILSELLFLFAYNQFGKLLFKSIPTPPNPTEIGNLK